SVTNICTCYVVLYLIYRSGQGWTAFGLSRPQWGDVLVGLLFFLIAGTQWMVTIQLLPRDAVLANPWSRPDTGIDWALLLVAMATVGFSEELVTRAYFITRLEYLLGSRFLAVVVSAGLFAACHIYYGPWGLVDPLLHGLIFGLLFALTRRLWPLVLAHMSYDIS